MSIVVKLSLAERFLNWYPKHTKLYIRGERGKDWETRRLLDQELVEALNPFLERLVQERVDEILARQNIVSDKLVCDWSADEFYAAKQLVLDYYNNCDGEYMYPSDVADKLGLDYELVRDVCLALIDDGSLMVGADLKPLI